MGTVEENTISIYQIIKLKIILCYILERKLLIGMICLNLFIFSSFLNKFNLNLLFILGLAKINLQNRFINKCYVKLIIFKKIYYNLIILFIVNNFCIINI